MAFKKPVNTTKVEDVRTQRRIIGLLEERRQYEQAGLMERVSEVNEQLRVYGHRAATPAKRAQNRIKKQKTER